MVSSRFFPDSNQLPLLEFCLARDSETARRAWQKWKTRVNLDDLDPACFRIMSLVYRRLIDLDIQDPDLVRIKGLYRYHWTRNQIAWRGKDDLVRTMHAQGIETLLLKGAALSGTVYPEPTTRGMHDLDLLVPLGSASRAMTLLRQRGWIAQHFDAVQTIDLFHGCSFLHPELGEFDLHWHVLRSSCRGELTDGMWSAARDFSFNGVPTKVLCPADQLLHACEHGMHPSPASALQWLVDATFIIKNSPPPFDWKRLVDQARKSQLVLTVSQTLRFLRTHFEPAIPANVIDQLAQTRVGPTERLEYFLAGQPEEDQNKLIQRLGVAACHYFKSRPDRSLGENLAGFPFYFRLLIHERREWPVFVREEWRTLRNKWRDDRAELCFRAHRLFRFESRPSGGLITRFPATDFHKFYPVEKEFGSPFRWSEAKASLELPMLPVRHWLRFELRPFRDLPRLLEDGLTLAMNGWPIPASSVHQEDNFLLFPIEAAWLKAGGRQTLGWSIQPWPAPGDPRRLGLPLSRLWFYRA